MKDIVLIIAAAGQGRRMKCDKNKQFIEIDGKAILFHTVNRFSGEDYINKIIVVHHQDEKQILEDILSDVKLPSKVKDIDYVVGGETRQQSIMNAMSSIDEADIVIVHDGARPIITEDMLNRLRRFIDEICADTRIDGAFFGVEPKDTIKQKLGNVYTTLDRKDLRLVQTPQIFKFKTLFDAHCYAQMSKYEGTDDCSLVEYQAGNVIMLKGDYKNIKITTPEDLEIAKFFMK